MDNENKLTEKEKEIIENSISYLRSVDLDEDDGSGVEESELDALEKLLRLHNKTYNWRKKMGWIENGFDFVIGGVMAIFFILIIVGIVLGLVASPPSFDLMPIWLFIKENIFIELVVIIMMLASWNMVKGSPIEESSNWRMDTKIIIIDLCIGGLLGLIISWFIF